MKIKILEVKTGDLKDAIIRKGDKKELPSIHEEWKFNFAKQLSKLSNAVAYVLVAEDTPTEIEGCMIFQMVDGEVPKMAYLEIAPHNYGNSKKHDHVAGCLIAYAYKQSFALSKKEHYKGILFFEVSEENPEDEKKLMAHYSKKYNAKLFSDSTMVITSETGGDELVLKYLPP
jgi:hypothetical protein